jgi:hypothetical protein
MKEIAVLILSLHVLMGQHSCMKILRIEDLKNRNPKQKILTN